MHNEAYLRFRTPISTKAGYSSPSVQWLKENMRGRVSLKSCGVRGGGDANESLPIQIITDASVAAPPAPGEPNLKKWGVGPGLCFCAPLGTH